MAKVRPFKKKLAGFDYIVLPKVFKGSTDSEILCDVLDVKKGETSWDIGTGTGLAALQAKKRGARYVLATDLNPFAVKNAKENSVMTGLKVDVKQADVFGDIDKKFDVITFNPPFTNHQARNNYEISFWDKDNKAVKKFFAGLNKHLNKNGRAFICWSSFGKIRVIKNIAKCYGFSLTELKRKKGKSNLVYYVFKVNNP